jgi:hypothetical protein
VLQLTAEYLLSKKQDLEAAISAPRDSLADQFARTKAEYEAKVATATRSIAARDQRIAELQRKVALEEDLGRQVRAALRKAQTREELKLRRKRLRRAEDSEAEPGAIRDETVRKTAKPPKIERKPVPIPHITAKQLKPKSSRKKPDFDLSEGEVRIDEGTISGQSVMSSNGMDFEMEEEEEWSDV